LTLIKYKKISGVETQLEQNIRLHLSECRGNRAFPFFFSPAWAKNITIALGPYGEPD